LLEWLSVLDNVLLPLSLKRSPARRTGRRRWNCWNWFRSAIMRSATQRSFPAGSRAASRSPARW
jgi:ABC-type nitrate/sulfonate/bicarbonate transport system ATPase subunit